VFLLDLLTAIFIVLTCWGTGRFVLKYTKLSSSDTVIDAVISAGIGFTLLVYIQMICGFTGLLSSFQGWTIQLAMTVMTIIGFILWNPKFPAIKTPHFKMATAIVLSIVAMSVLYLLTALAPTLEGDSLAGYLVAARDYAENGKITSLQYVYTNLLPANGQLLTAYGFSLKGQILAQVLGVWVMGVLGALAIYAIGKKWFSHRSGLIGAFIWYSMASVSVLSASAKIDLMWSAFDLMALLAFAHWYFASRDNRNWKWLLIAGLFLGVAGGIKQASIFTAMVFAVAIVYRLASDKDWELRNWVATLALSFILAVPAFVWVIRSILIDGTLGFTGSNLAGETGFTGFFVYLWDMSMLGNSASLEGPNGKSIGPVFMAVAPALILLKNVKTNVWHIALYAMFIVVVSFFTVQRARHILPALGIMALLCGYVIDSILALSPRAGRLLIAVIVIASTISLATWTYTNFVTINTISRSLNISDDQAYFASNLTKFDRYPNAEIISASVNLTDKTSEIASPGGSNGFYLERPLHSFTQTEDDIGEVRGFINLLKQKEITHVYINDFVVSERGHNESWLVREDFQEQFLLELICSGNQCLYELR